MMVAGVDVGGTKTVAVVGMPDEIAGRASGPGAAIRPGRALASVSVIAGCLRQALAQAGTLRCRALVVGAAGGGHPGDQRELSQGLRLEDLADRVRVTTDLEIALVGAFGDDPGIVLAAGTGSAVVARDAGGNLSRGGGHGWQMGDEGSGYALARAALGAVGRAHDGRGDATALTEGMLAAARCRDFDSLVRWAATATPGAVASLAQSVLEAANQGDVVASGLVDSAARDLEALAVMMLRHFPGDAPVPIALHGGMLHPGSALGRAVASKIRADGRFGLSEGPVEPAHGALRLAVRLLDGVG